ncbi:uncharacterized protein LOC125370793 [Ricinus communis]|uniref:uncharacterized protein LOC125370793 n=1 Tax=Ricinus communis TaxID=3988 RepID=UPI00201AF721|nr:uncharacterized protein LOC125370793 [Ricinus communis]
MLLAECQSKHPLVKDYVKKFIQNFLSLLVSIPQAIFSLASSDSNENVDSYYKDEGLNTAVGHSETLKLVKNLIASKFLSREVKERRFKPTLHSIRTCSKEAKSREGASASKKSKSSFLSPIGWLSVNFAMATITNFESAKMVTKDKFQAEAKELQALCFAMISYYHQAVPDANLIVVDEINLQDLSAFVLIEYNAQDPNLKEASEYKGE